MPTIHLSPTATPGHKYTVTAKTAKPIWTVINIRGINVDTGEYVYIKGEYLLDSTSEITEFVWTVMKVRGIDVSKGEYVYIDGAYQLE